MELDLPSRQTSATAARPTLRSAPQTVPSKKRNAAQHPLHARKSPREWDTQSPLETTVLSAAESPRTPRLGSKLSPVARSPRSPSALQTSPVATSPNIQRSGTLA